MVGENFRMNGVSSSRKLNCLFLNARSIMSNFKQQELEIICKEKNLDILGVVETWLHDGIASSEIVIDGYNVFRRDRGTIRTGRGGGILLLIRNTIQVSLCDFTNDFTCEGLVCEIGNINVDGFFIGIFYKPPNVGDDENQEMFKLIERISKKSCVLFGDFNFPGINWLENDCDAASESFLKLVNDCFLFQHVKSPTRGSNILDLVFSSEEGMVENLQVIDPLSNSDHSMVFFSLLCNAVCKSDDCLNSTMVYNFYKADYGKINQDIQGVNWEDELNGLNIQEMWDKFLNIINSIIKKYVPLCNVTKDKPKRNKWFTTDVKIARRLRQNAWNKYVKSGNQVDHDEYKLKLNQCTNEIRKAKLQFETSLASKAKLNCKPLFSFVRSKCRARDEIGDLVDEGGERVGNNFGKCNILNRQFSKNFNAAQYDNLPNFEVNHDFNVSLSEAIISEDCIINKLKNLNVNKSGGVDEIPSRFLYETARTIYLPLYMIFCESMSSGRVPSDWRKSNVTPIFKQGDKTDPNNYRPISLTCHISKLMESIIKDQLVIYLASSSLIKDTQHGFMKNKSCFTNLITFFECISGWVDNQEPVDVIYLDFKKAFDRVSHQLLLHKLQAYGVDGNLLKWIEDWLCGRVQRVVVKGSVSEWVDVTSGVPQGSVLGPILFTIFINDIDDGLINRILKFADDTKTFGKVRDEHDARLLQNDLNHLVDWSTRWGMDFNTGKCKVMHIGRNNPRVIYEMGGEVLEVVEVERDLGVLVSHDLKVSKQCVKSSSMANKMLGMILRCFTSRDRKVLVPLYKAIVRPHLDYCVQVWRPHLVKDIKLLEDVQHRATRWVDGVRGMAYEERLKVLGLMTLEGRRLRGDLIEVFKMYKGWSGLNFDDFFLRCNNNLRGNTAKIYKKRFNTNIGKFMFTNRVVEFWNKLPDYVLESNNINGFKNRLDEVLREEWGVV